MANKRRVVITGLGVATPIGIGVEAFWDALLRRACGLKRIEAFDPSGFACRIGGELPEFKLADYIPKTYRKSAKVMARDIQVAVVCAYNAVKNARIDTKCIVDRGEASQTNVDSARFGANIGAGLVCADVGELAGALCTALDDEGRFSLKRWGTEGMDNLTPLWLLKFLPNMLACHVTIVHDAQGPSNTITCGEASSHLAIGEAFRAIARGDAEVCICGGAESKINPMAMCRMELLGRLNSHDDAEPDRAVRPFGEGRRGTVAAEGGGLVMLESLEHAAARGARIYGEVIGFGAANNTHHWSDPDPTGNDVALALQSALRHAGVRPEQIDLVAPAGAGLKAHDHSESNGWNRVFGERLKGVPAVSSRPAVGTNGAGSGAVDFAAAVMALHHNTVPATLNTERLDPQCRLGFVQGDAIDAKIDHAISLGMALAGGQRAAVVMRRFEE